ncbi:UMP-CMP kinase 2, mitochondrial [Anoplophora glabripennis]|nr:UMP-CMP kinase 2, mitochondrial [Anoplophora glabripennis]
MLKILQKSCCVVSQKRIIKFSNLIAAKLGEKYIYIASDTNMSSNTLLYHSVESILDVFKKDENKDINGVKELMAIYSNAFEQQKKNTALGQVKQYPLIVLEGLDGSGKTTMGKRLAKKLNAKQWRTPPESISHLRNLFDDNVLRTAFYSLGNYIAALEVQSILRYEPVVMDRYWHSTAAYAIAQAVADDPAKYKMPPSGHQIYCWPNDLFKPDIVILLEVNEDVRLERHSRRKTYTTQEELLKSSYDFRQNVLQAYKNMYNPEIKSVDGNFSFGATLGQLEQAVRPLFY